MIDIRIRFISTLSLLVICIPFALGKPIIYDGRASLKFTNSILDSSSGPYMTGVKGNSQNASHYTTFLNPLQEPPTQLWHKKTLLRLPTEQAISVTIDNSSIFIPSMGTGVPQRGFRRTELIAQRSGTNNNTELNEEMETSVTIFHFSIKMDERRPLNYTHEYQIVFIEPSDGSHVFGIQLGSPFTNSTGTIPMKNTHSFKLLNHALDILFTTPFLPHTWHNFALQVNWDQKTLVGFYSTDNERLSPITKVPVPNPTANAGAAGRGDFHFGVLKLPLVDPTDSPTDQGDVVHHGLQEGTTEGLFYSGVFVESATGGMSVGGEI